LDVQAQESYNLVHHCGFSLSDVKGMSFRVRREYIKLLVDEREKEAEASKPEKMKPGEYNS